ncbi:PREDICTED: uncharacterized protein LOC106553219 [Thamnophis sirtalis]|uniref:Uncharacterized protein LOC106553219 n=1 Tax=Thamnophis sirtalis TaxID=35019 RepID=A0A6I9YS92_9SAUR|nr:PREDICTED: uncharacterized protein LOC106553219 [Thamnophis sirtalis]
MNQGSPWNLLGGKTTLVDFDVHPTGCVFVLVEDPELAAEEEGGCGESEDILGEAEAEGGERDENLKDPWQGISPLVNGTRNGAAIAGGASTPELTPSLAERSQELWSTQQGQLDGGLQVTDSTSPSPLPEGDLADNGPPQSMEQSPGEDFSTTESSAENGEGGGQESHREPEGEHVLLHGMASTTSQPSVSGPAADRWRSEDFAEPLLSSCFNPTLWLHD